MRVRVRSWHGVASWLWVANDENCGICRMAFNGCCPDCERGGGRGGAGRGWAAAPRAGPGLTGCPCRRQGARGRLPAGVGTMLALLPHALHPQVAELAAGPAALPHVPPGVEVQGVTAGTGAPAAGGGGAEPLPAAALLRAPARAALNKRAAAARPSGLRCPSALGIGARGGRGGGA